jgi:hypothetical protein
MSRVPPVPAALVLALASGLAAHANVPQASERPPLAACTAAAPAAGQALTGTVLQVVDGQTVCIALGPTPDQWVRVRLAGADADASRGVLMAATFGKELDCRMHAADGEGARADCSLAGVSVTTLLREPEVKLQATDWR